MAKVIKLTIGSVEDYIKANRRASRNEEINAYGHSLSFNRTWKSKRDYSRAENKRICREA